MSTDPQPGNVKSNHKISARRKVFGSFFRFWVFSIIFLQISLSLFFEARQHCFRYLYYITQPLSCQEIWRKFYHFKHKITPKAWISSRREPCIFNEIVLRTMKSERGSDEIFSLRLQMKLNPPLITPRSEISSRSDFIHRRWISSANGGFR